MKQVRELYGPYTPVITEDAAGIAEGPFTDLIESFPLWQDYVTAPELNALYMARSQYKWLAPGVESFFSMDSVDKNAVQKLVQHMLSKYKQPWSELWDTLSYEYNPIENYNMRENLVDDVKESTYGRTDTETRNLTDTLTRNLTDRKTYDTTEAVTHDTEESTQYGLKDTITHNTTDTITYNVSDQRTPNLESAGSVYGFNSNAAVNATKTNESGSEINAKTGTEATTKIGTDTDQKSGTDTTAKTGTDTNRKTGTDTDTHTGTDTDTHTGTRQNAAGGKDSETHRYTLTRQGNIGVTTTQQMIQAQRELWMWDYFDHVMHDIDKVIALSVY